MKYEQAKSIVEEAIDQRKRFGKHFTVSDMPPEFLDALVIVAEAEAASAVDKGEYGKVVQEREVLKEQLTLANRQLGAAKSRETQLRKQLAEVTKQTEV